MADRKSLLILRLEGPLQSWGESAKWDFRDSGTMPTKSGIVGLLGCAMGLEYGSPVLTELSQAISIMVRADRPGEKFVDFQTVHGNPMRTATGARRTIGDTIITPREYLQDASFTVFIDCEDTWRERFVKALQGPKWCMYLGRKNCVPSRPVYECVTNDYASFMEAARDFPLSERAEFPVTYECEEPYQAGASLFRSDDLVGANRDFNMRKVWRGVIEEGYHVPD